MIEDTDWHDMRQKPPPPDMSGPHIYEEDGKNVKFGEVQKPENVVDINMRRPDRKKGGTSPE